mgnify:CR=1 FL=1
MAYNPKLLTTAGINGRRVRHVVAKDGYPRIWSYMSDDSVATVRAAGYLADAFGRGMRKGDLVDVVVTSSGSVSAASLCRVMTCTRASGADLADGTAISVTNT